MKIIKNAMHWVSINFKVLALYCLAGLVAITLIGACASATAEETLPVKEKAVATGVERVCDSEYGNLIYKYRGYNIQVIPGGCPKTGGN